MAITQDQITDEDRAYADAFNEDAPAPAEQSEDDAFGLTPPAEDKPSEPDVSEQPSEGSPAVAVVVSAPPSGDETPAEGMEEQGEQPEAAGDTLDIAKETQRLKSWEGRLKKLEADLKAAAAKAPVETPVQEVASDAIEEVGEQAEDANKPELAEAAEKASEAVESGEMTPEEAMRQLAEDFGSEFVKMIEVIAAAKAAEAGGKAAESKFSEVGKTLDDVINSIVDDKARAHFEAIADEHPDFDEIRQNPAFGDFVKTYPNGEQIVEAGSARQINKMLSKFKAQAPAPAEAAPAPADQPAAAPAPAEDPGAAAAEGVRSSGLRLPEQPSAGANSYEDAWKDF